MTENLSDFAATQQQLFDASTQPQERKERGHFGTPSKIARFMASMISDFPEGTVRVLDPGAGVGNLAAAVCQRAIDLKSSHPFYIELWEDDPKVLPFLRRTMARCQKAVSDAGFRMGFEIKDGDFILANSAPTLFSHASDPFHIAILNPPYFKLRKESPQAAAMRHVVHGQPNIYALFMAVGAAMLRPDGEMIAITPRSYFNGPYFKRFRKWFFDRMSARRIHVFESRTEAFKDDAVLQENVILLAQKSREQKDVTLTSSVGRDLEKLGHVSIGYEKVIDNGNRDHVVRVTTNSLEHDIVSTMDALPDRFRNLGFEISTGPVVTFRSTELLRHERSEDTAPLLWMHNVRPFVTRFPAKNGKPTHIQVSKSSKKLLVRSKTYVLLKRFTSKEEKRRLVAGIMRATDSYSEWVGLENHLNYVYRKESELSEPEALGLAAFFNCAFVDRYFRAISGNTQVNAAEIRGMPVPDQRTLVRIGERIAEIEEKRRLEKVDAVVGKVLHLPQTLIEQLVEV